MTAADLLHANVHSVVPSGVPMRWLSACIRVCGAGAFVPHSHGQRVILAHNLLGTLRNRELAQVAKDIAAETGLEHRPMAEGQRVAGMYRRSVMLASGRYAMLDDGKGFSLVPWKPVIEQHLGQQLIAAVHSSGVSWQTGRQRGSGIGGP